MPYTESNKKKRFPLELFRFPVPFGLNNKWYVSQMRLSNGISETELCLFYIDQKLHRAKIFLLFHFCFSSKEAPFFMGYY